MRSKIKIKGMGIAWIVLLCIFVPPIGVLMLGVRYMRNLWALPRGGLRMCVTTGVMLMLGSMMISDETLRGNPIANMYAFAGLVGIPFSVLLLRSYARDKRCFELVDLQKLRGISAIAQSMHLSEEKVLRHLTRMLHDGAFPELELDMSTKTLKPNNVAMARVQVKSVDCERCGATVAVYDDRANFCEYCGSAVSF